MLLLSGSAGRLAALTRGPTRLATVLTSSTGSDKASKQDSAAYLWQPSGVITEDNEPTMSATRRTACVPQKEALGEGSVRQPQSQSRTKGQHPLFGSTLSSAPACSPSTPSQTRTLHSSASNKSLLTKLNKMLSKDAIIAEPGYNRFMNVPFSFLVQLSVGSVYAWSIFNSPLTRELGVVCSAADDWALTAVLPIFSACAATLGVTTAFLGPWAERSGPRKVAVAAGAAWGGGLLLTGFGTLTHTLPLCYLGYGILGGVGWGLGYITPVSTLMKWFPDRRGLATGLALTAFGGGAMLATPVNEFLFNLYFELPTYLGTTDMVNLVTESGRRFAEIGGEMKEVVVATKSDIAQLPVDNAQPGVYVVGTGNTGAASTFFTLGLTYWTMMNIGAFGQRVPPEGWKPEGWTPPTNTNSLITNANVHYNEAMKTPQFYLLWLAVAGNAIAGVTVMASAKNIMNDVFGSVLPHIVTGGFAAGYVAALSGVNMMGRLGWAAASDYVGRKRTYFLFGLGIPILAGLPTLTFYIAEHPSINLLMGFSAATAVVMSFYGGVFSVLPAYLADLFGQKHVGAIHGRQLTAWSAAALGGPTLLSYMRDSSYRHAIEDLTSKVDLSTFKAKFGADVTHLQELINAKTVTIPQLMEICPTGTIDPTPSLYNTTLYSMAGLLSAAFVCNSLIRPVDPKHHLPEPGPSTTTASTSTDQKA